MFPPVSQIKQLFLSPELRGSRSTPLRPLLTAMGVLLSAIVFIVIAGVGRWGLVLPNWVMIILVLAIALAFAVFGGVSIYAFIFLLHNKPDTLQSESFMLGKMAIEEGLFGDSTQLQKPSTNTTEDAEDG